jgi:hypothetical protein
VGEEVSLKAVLDSGMALWNEELTTYGTERRNLMSLSNIFPSHRFPVTLLRYGTRAALGIVLLLLLASPILASPLQQGCATMTFSPTSVSVAQVGDIVILQVPLDADGVTFDTVGFLINFDQTLLQVVSAAGDPVSQIEPGNLPGFNVVNTASNTEGTIEFAQAIVGGQTGGTFTVATIRFEVMAALPEGGTQVVFVGVESGGTGVFDEGDNLLCEAPQPATIMPPDCYDFQPPPGVDIGDIMLVASRWDSQVGNELYDPTYDLDHDGDIDVVDIMRVAAHWGEMCL